MATIVEALELVASKNWYGEPGDAKDPRLLSYAEVPPIAFSEAMGDLIKISGKSATQETEAADA
jgi:hypothetical protein